MRKIQCTEPLYWTGEQDQRRAIQASEQHKKTLRASEAIDLAADEDAMKTANLQLRPKYEVIVLDDGDDDEGHIAEAGAAEDELDDENGDAAVDETLLDKINVRHVANYLLRSISTVVFLTLSLRPGRGSERSQL
jgi:hypothetical protein